MDAQQLRYYLALQALPDAGPVAIKHLLQHYPSAEAFWRAPSAPRTPGAKGRCKAALSALWRARDDSPSWQQAQVWQEALQAQGIDLLCWQEPAYPHLLKQIPDCPALLYARGDGAALLRPQIAIVGSRNASRVGLGTAEAFAADLAASGLAVCSGLALGIDAAAHRGALAAGGVTTAVLGTGLDTIYPQRHQKLAQEITDGGTLLSEFSLGTPPRPGHFPRRNRIIAGLCVGTLVVEAAERSGSLITARLALEYNREVFAVPGSIHSPHYKGNHGLIRAGAKLVETTEQILEELGSLIACHIAMTDEAPSSRGGADVCPSVKASTDVVVPEQASARRVLDAVDEFPTGMDTIVERTGMSPEQLAETLLDLELSGCVELGAGGWQRFG